MKLISILTYEDIFEDICLWEMVSFWDLCAGLRVGGSGRVYFTVGAGGVSELQNTPGGRDARAPRGSVATRHSPLAIFSFALRQHTGFEGTGNDGAPAADAQLFADVFDVGAHSQRRDDQLVGDFVVGCAGLDQAQDF